MTNSVLVGRIVRAVVATALIADGLYGVAAPPALRTEMTASGFPMWTSGVIGASALLSGVLYAIPRTAVLGAVLATGFLGGAICTHLRLGELGSMPQLISLVLGGAAWGGLWLSNARVRALLPLCT